MLEIFLVSTIAVFVFSASVFYIESRIKSVQGTMDNHLGSIKDRLHADDRAYYEHRKHINHRIGIAEDKLGLLSDLIEKKRLEKEIQELQAELAVKSQKKLPAKKKGR